MMVYTVTYKQIRTMFASTPSIQLQKTQKLTLSREAVRTRVGSSWVVAMAVTQPPWPLSTPLSLSCSPIVLKFAAVLELCQISSKSWPAHRLSHTFGVRTIKDSYFTFVLSRPHATSYHICYSYIHIQAKDIKLRPKYDSKPYSYKKHIVCKVMLRHGYTVETLCITSERRKEHNCVPPCPQTGISHCMRTLKGW